MKKYSYFYRIGDCFSQLANVVIFNGNPNESVSGRSWREGWKLAKYIDFIFGKDHCYIAYLEDISYSARVMSKHRKLKVKL